MKVELDERYIQFFRLVGDNIRDNDIDPIESAEIWLRGFEDWERTTPQCDICGSKVGELHSFYCKKSRGPTFVITKEDLK